MPVVAEMVHPGSMDFANQRKCVVLRDVKGLSWSDIAAQCHTLRGKGARPSVAQCQRVYGEFSRTAGRRKYKYKNCGRSAWKVTPEVKKFLVCKMLSLRTKCVCTSSTLQRELLRETSVALEASTIRRVLQSKGYRWLPRCQKPKYSKEDKEQRLEFAEQVLAMTK